MSDPEPTNVVRQREWTEEELLASGFRYYPRKKQCVLVRELPEEESPKTIETSWASLVAHADALGLDAERMREALDERRHRQRVAVDAAAARALGNSGTPTFYVNGRRVSGTRFEKEIYNIIEYLRDQRRR